MLILNGPLVQVRYCGVFLGGKLVGGVHTSRKDFNVMWLHWETTGNGVGPEVANAILSAQIQAYEKAILNQPNRKMFKALLRIMSPQRKEGVTCHEDIASLCFFQRDLHPLARPHPSAPLADRNGAWT